MGKPTICGTCGWNNWKQHESVTLERPTSQASSEVREAKIKTAQQCLYLVQAHGDMAMRQIKNYICELEALAPSRQGAGGK